MFIIIATESNVDSHTLAKLLQLCQKNSAKLDEIAKRQERLEKKIDDQNAILSKFDAHDDTFESGKQRKGKGKTSKNDFYQVNICFNIIYYIYDVFISIIDSIYIHRSRSENWRMKFFMPINKLPTIN